MPLRYCILGGEIFSVLNKSLDSLLRRVINSRLLEESKSNERRREPMVMNTFYTKFSRTPQGADLPWNAPAHR